MVVGHMIVGPGEADRYLEKVLGRAVAAVDVMFVAVDPSAGDAERYIVDTFTSHWAVLRSTWRDHEGRFRQEAWDAMREAIHLQEGDMVLIVDADELIHDPEAVKRSIRARPGHKLSITFYEMWSSNWFRVDGLWKPYNAHIVIPWRDGGRFLDRPLACGRQPTYVSDVPPFAKSIGKILHYGYARPEDRRMKYERYMELDGGKYHNIDHLRSIVSDPVLMQWAHGGTIDV